MESVRVRPEQSAAGILLLMAASVGGATACGSDSDGATVQAGESTVSRTVLVDGELRVATIYGSSLARLLDAYPVVLVGYVEQVRPLEAGFQVVGVIGPGTPPPGVTVMPRPSPQPLPVGTSEYRVLVQTPVAGGLQAGGTITLKGPGAIVDSVAYIVRGEPLMEAGRSYLLFLPADAASGRGELPSAYARFTIGTDGRLSPSDPQWAAMGVVRALAGRPVDEVVPELRRLSADLASGRVTPEPFPSAGTPLVLPTVTPRTPTPEPSGTPAAPPTLPPFPRPPILVTPTPSN